MSDIDEIRKKIDNVDLHILELLNERAELALHIKRTAQGKAPIRPERESDVVHRLIGKNEGPLPNDALKEIFTQIIASFRDQMQLERPVSVGYLGPSGTYSEEAALKLFGSTIDLHSEENISDVVRAVEAGSVNLAVVPIENSSEGAVRETHRLLQNTDARIVAEVSLPVTHSLLSKADKLGDIKTVYAHPQALGQCRGWLAKHLPGAKTVPCASNSAAAELSSTKENSAAIASQKAGEIYGLQPIETGINDQPGNETRFIALAKLQTRPTGNDKTSIIIVLNDKPGALHEALGVFAEKNITMTRLESQPYKKGQYAFYIDFAGHMDDAEVVEALTKLNEITRICQVLGSYPREAGK